jgi:3-oxoadipate enol-lactonase
LKLDQGFSEVNGTRLYYEQAGDGRTIVFIHGFSLDCRMWDDQFNAFARNCHVVRYDLRGFGRSAPASDDAFSPVQDLQALLEDLSVQRACVVGLSLGGAIAIDYALAFPEATDALIAADSGLTGYAWPRGRPLAGPAEVAATEGIDAAKHAWLGSELFVPACEQADVSERLTEYVGDYSGWHWLNNNPAILSDPPAIERLENIQCPTLVIVGERDTQDFHEISEILTQSIPNANLCTIPRVGHMSNLEDAEGFNLAMLDFLE